VLAVPEPARAITMAGLAVLSSRHPIVVATPTAGVPIGCTTTFVPFSATAGRPVPA
jgi:hypothetical protein